MIVSAKCIDAKGRCCGRKPISYKRPRHLFCARCEAAFDPDDGRQIPNWAYAYHVNGMFERRTSKLSPQDDQRGNG